MLSYHVDAPRPVALMNELSLSVAKSVGKRAVFLLDGRQVGPGACRYPDADEVYQDVRDVALRHLSRPTPFQIELSAHVEAGVLRGVARVRGPERSGRRVHLVLAEKGAIYPGLGATVVHRMVARGALAESLQGLPWSPTNGVLEIPFECSLAEMEAANVAFLEEYEQRGGAAATRLSTRLQKDQLVVVAIVRERGTRLVDQAAQCDVQITKEEQGNR